MRHVCLQPLDARHGWARPGSRVCVSRGAHTTAGLVSQLTETLFGAQCNDAGVRCDSRAAHWSLGVHLCFRLVSEAVVGAS